MTEEEIREQKLQLCQQYGITEEQCDEMIAKITEILTYIVEGVVNAITCYYQCMYRLLESGLLEQIARLAEIARAYPRQYETKK